jgi:hypothetical protein
MFKHVYSPGMQSMNFPLKYSNSVFVVVATADGQGAIANMANPFSTSIFTIYNSFSGQCNVYWVSLGD